MLKKYAAAEAQQKSQRHSAKGETKGDGIPFGARAIESGIEVEGIWISNPNTPLPSPRPSATPEDSRPARFILAPTAQLGSKPLLTTATFRHGNQQSACRSLSPLDIPQDLNCHLQTISRTPSSDCSSSDKLAIDGTHPKRHGSCGREPPAPEFLAYQQYLHPRRYGSPKNGYSGTCNMVDRDRTEPGVSVQNIAGTCPRYMYGNI